MLRPTENSSDLLNNLIDNYDSIISALSEVQNI